MNRARVAGLSSAESRLKRFIIGAAGLLLLWSGGCHHGKEPAPSKPSPRDANLLLITLDTTRADHLRCYSSAATPGETRAAGAKTPHLDALAARGVRFAEATVQAPLTLPSHASLMTGEYPTRHGLRDITGFFLDKSHPSIATITQASGYATAAFVGSRVLARQFGLSNGFATYDDKMGKADDRSLDLKTFAERRADVVTDHALAWLKQNGKKRFFLWVHYYDPHHPYDPPEPYKHAYAKDLYSGEIAYMDEQVGRLLDALESLGLQSRTLVAAIGDHGESLGEHGELTHGIFLYDSTLRVPFLMAGPDVPQGKVIDAQVRSIDLMPTMLEFLHLPPGPEVQGVTLWPLIKQGTRVRSNYSYSETLFPRITMGWSELRAMRTDQWKLIVAPHPELYNLERDPAETKNLIASFPTDADQLQKKIWEVAGEGARQEKVSTTPLDPQTRQELESLGYVSAGTSKQIQLGSSAPDPKDRVAALKVLDRADRLIDQRAFARAAQVLEQNWRVDPTNPRFHLQLANAYESMGKYPRAIEILQDAVKQHVETDKVYARLGIDYTHLGQTDKALAALAHAAELNPSDLDNLLNLGMTYTQLNRLGDGERTFKAIIAQNDRYAGAYTGLGLVAVQRNDLESARRNFEKTLAINPDDPQALLDLGILFQKLDNKQQAIHYLQLFLDKAPRDQFGNQFPAVREAINELKSR